MALLHTIRRPDLGWNGDEFGNEWDLGFAVHFDEDSREFEVYEDDGHGNGSFVTRFATESEALAFVRA